MNSTNIDYDYYFALGYETKDAIDLFLKYNPPKTEEELALAFFNSPTDSLQSQESTISAITTLATERIESSTLRGRRIGSGTHSTGTIGVEPAISGPLCNDQICMYPKLDETATLYNKYQIDFDVVGLFTAGLDPYNPDDIDITVLFKHTEAGHTTTIKVNAYYGKVYNRNLCAIPDPTYIPSLDPTIYKAGITNMFVTRDVFGNEICKQDITTFAFKSQSINYNTPGGDPAYLVETGAGWHARFAPPATGLWSYSFLISIAGAVPTEHIGPFNSFNVEPSNNPGYVGTTNRNFILKGTRDIFIPMGCLGVSIQTAKFFNRSLYAICIHAIDQLALNKGNHLRIFCTYDAFGIECGSGSWTAGNYDYGQDRAFDLDDVIVYAEQNGVYVQFVLDERSYFIPDDTEHWEPNPYRQFIHNAYLSTFGSSVNYNVYGPGLFFTDDTCKKYYKRKLRYMMARWGYSTNVFAFEFFNEVTLWFFNGWSPNLNPGDLLTWATSQYTQIPGTVYPVYKSPGYIQVSNWVNEMIDYCKIECYQYNNHIFTISAPGSESNMPNNYHGTEYPRADDFINLMNIDFYTYHFYDTTQFTDYRINFLANRAKWLYPTKPFIIGEYWLANSDDNGNTLVSSWVYTNNFTTGVNTLLYDCADFHNALFASILSGCGGAVQPWDSDMAGSPWGGQLAYYKPLAFFLAGEDQNWDNCKAIRNNCYEYDLVINEAEARMPSINANYQNNALPDSLFNINITAIGWYDLARLYETKLIEVFALQYFQGVSRGKIIGWVKNSNNWWFNLPHPGDDDSSYLGGYNPSAKHSGDFVTIYEVELTIADVCNGSYKIEFYNVYPDWPDNGGVIATIYATSVCNSLTFTVPYPLDALKDGNAPIAPDYGFKATPIDITWGYGYLCPRFHSGVAIDSSYSLANLQPFSVGNGGKLVVFVTLNQLHIYTRDSTDTYTWFYTNLYDINPNFRTSDAVVALGANDSQFFYKGADNKLHCAYNDGTGWQHAVWEHVVGGDIAIAGNGGKVFFRGSDGDLHFLLWGNSGGTWGWQHTNYTASVHAGHNQKPHPSTNISVNEDGSFLAYRTNDGKLAIIFETGVNTYWYNWVDVNVGGMIRVNNAGDVVFYTDNSNYLKAYYWDGTTWARMGINTAYGPINFIGPFDIVPDWGINNQIYFQGYNGFIHVAFQEAGLWVEGPILCEPEPASRKCMHPHAYIRYSNGAVIYQDALFTLEDNAWYYGNLSAYYYGKGDVDDI